MKKNLIALSMMATAGLFAESGNNQPMHQQSGYCNTCCCTPCCCKPCCVPQPKKCIDCECYVPAFYDLQCDWGFFASADFLYWYASEPNLIVAAELVTQSQNNALLSSALVAYINEEFCVESCWDPGVRVALGWNSECDGWDVNLNWTYLKNSTSKSVKGNNELAELTGEQEVGVSVLINPWVASAAYPRNTIGYFDSVKAEWKLRFNQIDLEIGRKYWLSPCFTLRPFAGIRGAWTRTNYNLKTMTGPGLVDGEAILTFSASDRFKNSHWGVGFLGGVQPSWYFCSNMALYGSFNLAVIWGEHKGSKEQEYIRLEEENQISNVTFDTVNSSRNNCYLMSTLFDAAIGLRWEETWCCDRYRTALDLGWEHHTWVDHNFRYTTSENSLANSVIVPRSVDQVAHNLGYGGFVLRVRFDF